jgi:hypothetical protein
MSSSEPSEPGEGHERLLLDLERDVPTTAADCAVLRALRDQQGADPFPDLSAFPATAAALAGRPSSEGWPELEL